MATYPVTVGEVAPYPNIRIDQSELPDLVANVDIGIAGNWGDNPSFTVDAGSNDQRGCIRITTDVNLGANPTWSILWRGGPWNMAPYCVVVREGAGNQPSTVITAASMIVTQGGAISVGTTIVYRWMVMG